MHYGVDAGLHNNPIGCMYRSEGELVARQLGLRGARGGSRGGARAAAPRAAAGGGAR